MARQQKTEQQRAEELLAVAERKHDKATANVVRLRKDLKAAEAALEQADQLLDYRRQHPALPSTTPTTTKETTTP